MLAPAPATLLVAPARPQNAPEVQDLIVKLKDKEESVRAKAAKEAAVRTAVGTAALLGQLTESLDWLRAVGCSREQRRRGVAEVGAGTSMERAEIFSFQKR